MYVYTGVLICALHIMMLMIHTHTVGMTFWHCSNAT
jgi:hypothetical protein